MPEFLFLFFIFSLANEEKKTRKKSQFFSKISYQFGIVSLKATEHFEMWLTGNVKTSHVKDFHRKYWSQIHT